MTERFRTVLFGLGAIGAGIGRLAASRAGIELVGAIDSAPDKAGRPLAEVLGVETARDVVVHSDASDALTALRPQVVLHATGSYLPDVHSQLLACTLAGANVVSTCEELAYPWHRHPDLASALDEQAKSSGATLLGTGVNPGFVMDTLAVALTAVCQQVERVTLSRTVDVASRRVQLQRKVGMGLTVDEFRSRVAEGLFGHVGLPESCWLLANGLGWTLDALDETIEPVPGKDSRAAGMRQTAIGKVEGRIVIDATVQMSSGAGNPRDEIVIDGVPLVRMVIEGGVQGDAATAAIVVNAIAPVVAHEPGLVTMLELPPIRSRGT